MREMEWNDMEQSLQRTPHAELPTEQINKFPNTNYVLRSCYYSEDVV